MALEEHTRRRAPTVASSCDGQAERSSRERVLSQDKMLGDLLSSCPPFAVFEAILVGLSLLDLGGLIRPAFLCPPSPLLKMPLSINAILEKGGKQARIRCKVMATQEHCKAPCQ